MSVYMQVEEAIRPMASRYFFILYLPMLPRAATIIFGALLRAAGDTKTPMKVGVVVNIINVTLNFLLIYPTRPMTLLGLTFTMPGAGLGVEGAAIASAIAVTVGGAYIAVKLWRHPLISPRGQRFRPDWAILPKGFPPFFPMLGRTKLACYLHDVNWEYYEQNPGEGDSPFPRHDPLEKG